MTVASAAASGRIVEAGVPRYLALAAYRVGPRCDVRPCLATSTTRETARPQPARAHENRSSPRRITRPPNKGMKQTKPSVLELRSLSPVFDGPTAGSRERGLAKSTRCNYDVVDV